MATELVLLNTDIVIGKAWKLFYFFTFILWFTLAFILNTHKEYFKIFNYSILLIQTCSDITRIFLLFSSPCTNKCFIFITWKRCDVISLSPRKRRNLLICSAWPLYINLFWWINCYNIFWGKISSMCIDKKFHPVNY